jgi:hypothetical protein
VSRVAVLDSVILAIACLITFMLVTDVLTRVYHLSRADGLIGGLWAVIATVFVFRDTYQHSVSAAVTRIAATGVSLVLCLACSVLTSVQTSINSSGSPLSPHLRPPLGDYRETIANHDQEQAPSTSAICLACDRYVPNPIDATALLCGSP